MDARQKKLLIVGGAALAVTALVLYVQFRPAPPDPVLQPVADNDAEAAADPSGKRSPKVETTWDMVDPEPSSATAQGAEQPGDLAAQPSGTRQPGPTPPPPDGGKTERPPEEKLIPGRAG
jgi:hypothetical protein